MEKFDKYIALLGRILLAQIFIVTGIGKMIGDAIGIIAYMESFGVPGFLFWPSSLFETIAGVAILIGFQTRLTAALLAGFCLLTTALFHTDISDNMQMGLFLRNIAMAGGLLMLVRFGAGEFSLDNKAEGDA